MSISSWFFGNKKKPSPQEEDRPPISGAEEADEFVVIEKRRQTTIVSGDYSNTMYPNLPYSLGPALPNHLAHPQHHLTRVESVDYEKNMLHDIPFKLSPALTAMDSNQLKETSTRVSDILFKIKRMDKRHYDYDFNVENSVATD